MPKDTTAGGAAASAEEDKNSTESESMRSSALAQSAPLKAGAREGEAAAAT